MSVIFSIGSDNLYRRARPPVSRDPILLPGNNGSTLILIHGLTGTPVEVRFLANYFNKKGYTVICPWLANHGEELSVLKYTKWQDFYDSVRNAFLENRSRGANGPVFVSGLSLGALLALLLAEEFPESVKGVSCLAPTLFYDGWNTPTSKCFLFLAHTPIRYIAYFKEEPPYGIKNETIRERIHRYYSKATLVDTGNVEQYGYPYFPVALLYQLQLLVKHLMKRLDRISVPVQCIQAKDDDMTSVKNSKCIYDGVTSKLKEIILLYNSYHVITADQERDIVADKMEGFFTRARAPR